MKITVMSGKGGAGKTTFSIALAMELSRRGNQTVLADLDVDEPDVHLYYSDRTFTGHESSVMRPVWSQASCTFCGNCSKVCRFHALAALPGKVLVFPELCHSCYACSELCPAGALVMKPHRIGMITQAQANEKLDLIQGVLDVGQEIAASLVRQTRSEAENKEAEFVVYDAPPGSACAAREAMLKSDVVILVTEPTPFGLHDMELVFRLATAAGKKVFLIINRAESAFEPLEHFVRDHGLKVLARIPFIPGLSSVQSAEVMLTAPFKGLVKAVHDTVESLIALKAGRSQ